MKNWRTECPYYHTKQERRIIHNGSPIQVPSWSNLKFNPNKVYTANVNNMKELQIIKEMEQRYNSYRSYVQSNYSYQTNSYYSPQSESMIIPESAMIPPYFADPYLMQTQQWSPQPSSVPVYQYNAQVQVQPKTKPTSKLSTKSPHAITGHKFHKSNTMSTSQDMSRSGLGGAVMTPQPFLKTPISNFSFGQALNNSGKNAQNYKDYEYFSYDDKNQKIINQDYHLNFVRKSTFDETEAYANISQPLFISPEENKMKMKLIQNFNLNPFPIESEDDEEIDDIDQDNTIFTSKILPKSFNKKNGEYKGIDNDIFNVFGNFPVEDESFQNEELKMQGSSSGPIISLLSKAEVTGTQS